MTTKSTITPKARIEDLVTNDVGSDVLVYDLVSFQLHTLNASSANVWRACDGVASADEIARRTGLSGELVMEALAQLSAANLLEDVAVVQVPGATQSRRRFLKRAVATGAAVPVIASITAPSAFANHSQGDCIPHRTHVVDAITAHDPLCTHCCRPDGADGWCYFQPIEPFGGWFCWGE